MARQYRFEATPTVQNGQVVEWKLCYFKDAVTYPQCGITKGTYPNASVKMGDTGVFQYSIMGDSGITFAPSPPPQGPPSGTDPGPIWVNEKGQPNQPGVDPQIGSLGGGGSKKLTFVDLNTDAATLKYQLNFVDSQGKAVAALDPEIINGGKGLFSNVAFVIAAGVAIALLALWAWKIMADRRNSAAPPAGAGADQRAE